MAKIMAIGVKRNGINKLAKKYRLKISE